MVTATEPVAHVRIAKFLNLRATTVQQHLDVSWESWLSFLAEEPAEDFRGPLEHPGWSPAVFNPPARAKENVSTVAALVLDHDHSGDFAALIQLWAGRLGVVYTTKSHRATAPRLRVVLPFTRPVGPDEYARAWEWAAARSAEVGCPADPQCKDVSRFWYDPSRTADGTWRAERLTGAAIDPDTIPAPQPKLRIVKPTRPLTETERTKRARAYLKRIPGAVSGAGGHTQTFNAVAAVMIGFDLDADATRDLITSEYNPRCEPPWSERELDHKIASVSERCTRERGYLLTERPRIQTTTQAAQHAPTVPDELSVDWESQMLRTPKGGYKRAYHNTAVFVRHYPTYRGKWSVDQMTEQPWFDGAPMPPTKVHDIRSDIEQQLGFTPSVADVEAAIAAAVQDRPFHPIQQYLRSLDWDGTPRLHAMARDYLGSDAEHHAEMVRRFMISAAARVLWPGCKVDTALMLIGAQGIRKSTFFKVLGGTWHADSFIDITNKDGTLALHSAWIYELAELENVVTGRAESRLKAWMTSTHDTFRIPYGKAVVSKPRAVVVCGTTNREQFLTDDTGSRRFWIVPVRQRIPTTLLEQMRDQLWAEAVAAAEAGEQWWLSDEMAAVVEQANVEHHEDDPWIGPVAQWIASPSVREVTTSELLTHALKLEVPRQDRAAQMRVGRVLKKLGWDRQKRRTGSATTWVYVPTSGGNGNDEVGT